MASFSNPFPAFTPNSRPQKEFLQAIADGTPVTLLCSGRKLGKTICGAAAALLVTYVLGKNQYRRGLVVTPTIEQTRQAKIEFEKVAGWLNKGGFIKKFLHHENTFILRDNYRIEFRTASEPDNLRGPGVDWLWVDEAGFVKDYAWDVLQDCVSISKGPVWLTTTPPNSPNWVYDIYNKAMEGVDRYKYVQGTTFDNPLQDVPFLLQMEKDWSEERRRREHGGEFVFSQGLVYPMFKEEFIQAPPKKYSGEVVVGIDPGANDPFAYLWVVKNGGHFWVVDEYYSTERRTLAEHVKRIQTHQWESSVSRRWSDPARAQDNLDLMVTYGLENWKAKNDLKAGIEAVASAIERKNLFIDPYCKNLIKEIRQYSYKAKGEAPIDKDNHALDALRYIIYSEKGIGGSNEVFMPLQNGTYATSIKETGAFNDVFMPDGTTISGFDPEGPKSSPGSRR